MQLPADFLFFFLEDGCSTTRDDHRRELTHKAFFL